MSVRPNELEAKIMADYRKYIDSLERRNPDCKILYLYKTIFIYDINKFPEELVTKYKQGNKNPLLTLIFLLETEAHMYLPPSTKEDAKLWINFLKHNEKTEDFFEIEVTLYNHTNSKISKTEIKISDIEDDFNKLRSLADVIDKYRTETYNCAPHYIVALRTS